MNKIVRVAIYTCDRCKEEIIPPEVGAFTSNYGSNHDGTIKHCFPCCGALDREYMIAHGKITLYLVERDDPNYFGHADLVDYARLTNAHIYPQRRRIAHYVVNWPGSLSFQVTGGPYRSSHNKARFRYDVWFVGPDGHLWHGYKCGDNTDICHCKRTKRTVKNDGFRFGIYAYHGGIE